MKRASTVIVACALSSFGVVQAQQTDEPQDTQAAPAVPVSPHQEQAIRDIDDDLFDRLDQDRNGMVSHEEAQAEPSLMEKWTEYDKNSDQMLDRQEMAAVHPSGASEATSDIGVAQEEITEEGLPASEHQRSLVGHQLLDQLDEDGDGKLSQQEAESDSKLTTEWARLDTNQDGDLDSDELSKFEQ